MGEVVAFPRKAQQVDVPAHKPVVTVSMTGEVEVHGDLTEASQAFWTAVAHVVHRQWDDYAMKVNHPAYTTVIVSRLRERIKRLETENTLLREKLSRR